MKSETVGNVATIALVGCALVVTLLLIKREFMPTDTNARMLAPSTVKAWATYGSAGHRLGPIDAPATIIEFADFECPYCRRFAQYVDSINADGPLVNVLYRHYPIQGHRFAMPAAKASECAARQGRFAQMHDDLFTFADSLGLVTWWWFAKRAGVADSTRFAECLSSTEEVTAIARDIEAGKRLGVVGTPTLLIGELRFDGVPSLDSLRAYVKRVNKAKTPR